MANITQEKINFRTFFFFFYLTSYSKTDVVCSIQLQVKVRKLNPIFAIVSKCSKRKNIGNALFYHSSFVIFFRVEMKTGVIPPWI